MSGFSFLMGLLGLGAAGIKNMVGDTQFAAQNARFSAEMKAAKFNEEKEIELYKRIQRYQVLSDGTKLSTIRYGYGTMFPRGEMQRDLFYLNLEMKKLGYDCRRWIEFNNI